MEDSNSIELNASGEVQAHGNVAMRLLNNGFNLRYLRTNETLRKDEWEYFDTQLVEVAKTRLRAFRDLQAAGLVKPVMNPYGTMIIRWEQVSEFTDAMVSMDLETESERDRPTFSTKFMPVPVIQKDFQIKIRQLAASRTLGEPLDTVGLREAADVVMRKIETMIISGVSGLKYGTGTIQGYTTATNRNTVSLGTAWTDSAKTGNNILDDVLDMISAAHTDKHYGPYMLYIPTAYGIKIENDFKANSDRTIRERLEAIDGMLGVRVLDSLPANNVVLVQMTDDVVDYMLGFPPTIIFWETMGGMMLNFKVVSIGAPRVRDDINSTSGIVHLS